MYVIVTRANGGQTVIQESVADVFETDTLTITCTDQAFAEKHGPLQVFAPGTWKEATVYRDNGFPDYAFQGAAHRADRQQLAAALSDPRRI